MKIYNYNASTLEYTGESIADESPLEPGVFLIPAFSTPIKPLPATAGKMRLFVNGSWSKVDIPPPVVLPPPVARITALQGLLAIDRSGLATSYDAWADDPARTFAERAFINKAQDWRRDDATLAGAATALGLTDAQVDAMFELAATL